ncbi:tyrosine-type recombinase/integrase [Streptomyces sp. NPDC055287]
MAVTSVTFAPVSVYRAERAESPTDGKQFWVVVSDAYELHPEGCAYIESLRANDRSWNTERLYAGRVALYLSRCSATGTDWRSPSFLWMSRFLHWLVEEPLPPRGRKAAAEPRYRDKATANKVLTTVGEFLRFGVPNGWVELETAAMLSQPKYLQFLPSGHSAGEDGQHRIVQAKTIKFKVAVPGYEWLTDEQYTHLIDCTTRARDRFLVTLLGMTGVRIGEALGLHREDMHLLANSATLGCRIAGPHVHVRRRRNSNGALAKARKPRSIPVEDDLTGLYADYLHERSTVAEATACQMVFVNLFRSPLGRPMTYPNAKDLFDRLAKRAGFTARPHMLRHTALTRWARSGVERDVIMDLAGHVSPTSADPYVHTTEEDKRAAVTKVAAQRRAGVSR